MKIVLALMALSGMVQDKEDPRYKYWSNCKVGSWVKTRTVMDQGGAKGEVEQIQKLLEIAEDKITIEVSGTMKMNGRELPMPARKQEIKAKYAETDTQVEKEGDEEIEVAGKKLQCHWLEMTMKTGPSKGKMKVWMSPEVPGGGAQAEVTPPNGKTMTISAVEWEKK